MLDINNNEWKTPENMTIKSIPSIEQSALKERKKLDKGVWIINCGKTKNIDSAGLAWLVNNISFANKKNITLQISNLILPNAISLSKAYGIIDILKKHLEDQS